jgi:hypothetical protein
VGIHIGAYLIICTCIYVDTTLPQCKGAISIAGVAPWGQQDLDFLAGQGQENIEEFGVNPHMFDCMDE